MPTSQAAANLTPPQPPPYPEPMTMATAATTPLRFALSWHRTEIPETLSRRGSYLHAGRIGWRRPLWLALALVYATLFGLAAWVIAWGNRQPVSLQVLAATAGAALGVTILLTGLVTVTAFTVRRAAATAWIHDTRGTAGAIMTTRRAGGWNLYCVHARPTGAGLGRELMDQVTALADRHHQDLHLIASHPDAVRFYVRHGFTPRAPGSLRMDRTAAVSESPQHGKSG